MTQLEKAVWGAAFYSWYEKMTQSPPKEHDKKGPLSGLLSEEEVDSAVQRSIEYADSTLWYLRQHVERVGFLHVEEIFEAERKAEE